MGPWRWACGQPVIVRLLVVDSPHYVLIDMSILDVCGGDVGVLGAAR